jgi:hypothetical protein
MNKYIGSLALVLSTFCFALTFSVVYIGIEKGGVAYSNVVGWFCIILFIVSLTFGTRALDTTQRWKGVVSIIISTLCLPLFLTFRHVL